MKKLFTLLCLCVLSLFNSCDQSQQLIWDYVPYTIKFVLKDAAGENLLNPQYQYNAYTQGVQVIVNNEVFDLEFAEGSNQAPTRAMYTDFYGAKVMVNKDGVYYAIVGEFDAIKNVDDSFNVCWSDGTYDRITYSHRFETDKSGAPTINETKIWLNGKEVENGFTIIHTL